MTEDIGSPVQLLGGVVFVIVEDTSLDIQHEFSSIGDQAYLRSSIKIGGNWEILTRILLICDPIKYTWTPTCTVRTGKAPFFKVDVRMQSITG